MSDVRGPRSRGELRNEIEAMLPGGWFGAIDEQPIDTSELRTLFDVARLVRDVLEQHGARCLDDPDDREAVLDAVVIGLLERARALHSERREAAE